MLASKVTSNYSHAFKGRLILFKFQMGLVKSLFPDQIFNFHNAAFSLEFRNVHVGLFTYIMTMCDVHKRKAMVGDTTLLFLSVCLSV